MSISLNLDDEQSARLEERARQLGDEFTVKRFFDEINGAGLIPMSLIRWELSGQADEIIRMAAEN